MTFWERFVSWLEGRAGPPEQPEIDLPEYDRPYVRRTTEEQQRRAEDAVRTLEAYVRAQSPRRDDPGRRR